MKRNIINYILYCFVLSFLIQGCVKESFEGDNVGDKGTTFLKTPSGGEIVQWLTPSNEIRKISLFKLFKDANSAIELNKLNTVKILLDPSIITKYNTDNKTDFEILPSGFFTWVQDNGVSVSNNELSVVLGNGLAYGDISVLLDGSKWNDIAQKYALAFVIKDYGNIKPSSSLSDTVIVQLGLKNQWDGIYKITGTITDLVSPAFSHVSGPYADQGYGDYIVELHTLSETKVVLFDDILWGNSTYPIYSGTAWSGYGNFAPVFEFDKATNKIIGVTNYHGQPASNTRSAELDPSGENYYDEDKKILKVKYFMIQPSSVPTAPHLRVIIDEEYSFSESRK